jgi:hypothetical protein
MFALIKPIPGIWAWGKSCVPQWWHLAAVMIFWMLLSHTHAQFIALLV